MTTMYLFRKFAIRGRNRRSRVLVAGAGVAAGLALLPVATSPVAGAVAAPGVSLGAAPPAPSGVVAQTPLPSATTLDVTVVLEPRDPAELADFATEVSTPGTPEFRRYLAPGQFADLFGPTASTVAAVRDALLDAG